jgi:glycosyltransferase involved in cell wall biosynthesis
MITGHDIVFISSIEWDFLWQVHQEVALHFAKAGNRVLYIENTGIRVPRPRDSARIVRRLQRWISSLFAGGVREVLPNILVSSPLVLPPFGGPVARWVNRWLLITTLRRILTRLGRDPLLWTYLPTDTAVELIRSLSTEKSVVVYYCGADFSLLASHSAACRNTEVELLRLSDIVLTICPALADRCKLTNDNVHIVPPMIDLGAFPLSQPHEWFTSEPPQSSTQSTALQHLPRPIIGYVGGLHRLLDVDLLAAMIKKRPRWSWVFVGGATSDMGKLRALPNVRLAGQLPHKKLANWIGQFDVCIVPYLNNALTATVVPMKIGEYLAMGKPVVSTDLPMVREFNDRHRILITAPNDAEKLVGAIEESLALPMDHETIARRREVARTGDADNLLERISEMIEAKIREKNSRSVDSRSLPLAHPRS